MGLTEQERERLTDWVFSQTDAKVISDPNFWTEERMSSINGMAGIALSSFAFNQDLTEDNLDSFIQSLLKDRSMDVCDRVEVAMAAARGFIQR